MRGQLATTGFLWDMMEKGLWFEGLVVEYKEHGIKANKVGAACKNDQKSMQQLTIQLLYLEEHIGTRVLPHNEHKAVLLALHFYKSYYVSFQVLYKASEGEFMVE